MVGALEAAMTGASWTRSRIATLGSNNLDTDLCARCGAAEETDLRGRWARPCKRHFAAISQNLVHRAVSDFETLSCL